MQFFADLHIHIGRAKGRPIKITASPNLTVENILSEALNRKGLDIVGIVDSASPEVLSEIRDLVKGNKLIPLCEGGLLYEEKLLFVPAVEVETKERVHFVGLFPDLKSISSFADIWANSVSNMSLSTQKSRFGITDFIRIAKDYGAVVFPAHAFTPHRGVYGCLVGSLGEILDENTLSEINSLELGLSCDERSAMLVRETRRFTYLSNSDAHSLEKIGREYNVFEMKVNTFNELKEAISGEDNRKKTANFGLDPRLGKYHRSYCSICHTILHGEGPHRTCPSCKTDRGIIMGVYDRLLEIADCPDPNLEHPTYRNQVPLLMMPGVGKKRLNRLLLRFGTEMKVLHEASEADLRESEGERVARVIIEGRKGTLPIEPGGGGYYGKVLYPAATN